MYKKWIGRHFGRFFAQTHLVTLSEKSRVFGEKLLAGSYLTQRYLSFCGCITYPRRVTNDKNGYVLELGYGETDFNYTYCQLTLNPDLKCKVICG
jgi:hypothetical protein